MQNLDDKYFFDRVKSVLEDFEPGYQADSWTKLSGRLDRYGQTVGHVRWKLWLNGFICGSLLVGVIVGVYLLLTPGSVPVVPVDNSRTVQLQPGNLSGDHVSGNQPETPQQLPNTSDRIAQQRATFSQPQVVPVESVVPVTGNRNMNADDITNRVSNDRWAARPIGKTVSPGETVSLSESSPQMERKTPVEPDALGIMNLEASVDSTILPNLPNLLEIPQSSEASGDSTRRSFQDSVKSERKKKNCFNWDIFRIDLGLNSEGYRKFVGPDRLKFGYSPEIVFGNFQDQTGWSNGAVLMIEGPLSSRIRVGAGLSFRDYSWRKTKEFGQYTRDSITVPEKYTVDSMLLYTGHWRYFEIPVELGLIIVSHDKWSMGANVSVAAQIMQRERYTLTKMSVGDSTINTTVPDATNYAILGNLRFGLEYRYRFGERWSLWVEPYYKFQLKSIGASGLKPKYLGVNAGIVFQFNLYRRKQVN